MVITQINETEELNRGNLVLKAEKFAVSKIHWGNWEDIKKFLLEVESLFYLPEDNFDRHLCSLMVALCKNNTRLKEVKFFHQVDNPKHLICCLWDDTKNVYKVGAFESFISMEKKREGIKFTFVEVPKILFKEDEEIKYPSNWQPISSLNSLFDKLYCFL